MYFTKCKYAEEGKKLYKELCHRFHPDNGGDPETMKAINQEFTDWWKTHKNRHYNAAEHTEYEQETTERAEDFIEILDKLFRLAGINIEICGSWLWIRGNTYPVKDQLKAFGCKYSSSKKCWFWCRADFTKKRMKTKSMKDIRAKYGSEQVEFNPSPLLT